MRPLDWIANNPSVIISFSSMAIALISLVYTLRQQRLDNAYKELSIRPVLRAHHNSGDLSYVLSNQGVGPAVILRSVFIFDNKCYELGRLTPPQLMELTHHLGNFFIFSHIKKLDIRVPTQADAQAFVGSLYPGTVVGKGESVPLFNTSPAMVEALKQAMGIAGAEVANEAMVSFSQAAIKLPLVVEYCSLSGLFCQRSPQPFCTQAKAP
jgi:hypothetical protein